MKTLSQYLHKALCRNQAEYLLILYPNNDAVKILKHECPNADIWDLLAAALYSGSKPELPKIDLNAGGIYPAVEEQ